jgi:exopolyphosphatase/guanosine-5'-triphosphate,3'-diphosphate pyrophosphatase
VIWKEMEKWIRDNVKEEFGRVTSVGTGGNISKLFDLAELKAGAVMSLKKVKELKSFIEKHTIEERIYKLQMNPDRADVIVPASGIYINVMEWAHSHSIIVPEVGLKDGIMLDLFEKNAKLKKVSFINTEDQSKGKKTTPI